MDVAGKIILVTGAGSGLGRAACVALGAAGARIAAFDRDADALDMLAPASEYEIVRHQVDVADEENVVQAVTAVAATMGGLHVALNCAGVGDPARTVSRKGVPFPGDMWARVIGINLTGTFNVVKHAARVMLANEPDRATGERGVLINTASGAATQGQVGQAAYAASKAGIIGMMLPVARDLAVQGIRVVTISPGLFGTPLVASLSDDIRQALIDKAVLFPRRMGEPGEFAATVRHVIENAYLNATTIELDAGARNPNR